MNEEDLIKQAQKGDQQAFRQLLEIYATLTERTARVLLPDRASAEDAVQEAWLDVWRGLRNFEPERPFRPWLLTIVANRCRMAARQQHFVSVPMQDVLPEENLGLVEDIAATLLSPADYSELQKALDELRPEQRQILALRFFADLELAEIAALAGISLGTVKSRLHRTLQTLRSRLQDPQPLGVSRNKGEK